MQAYLIQDTQVLATGNRDDISEWKKAFANMRNVVISKEIWHSKTEPEVIPEPEGELITEDKWKY